MQLTHRLVGYDRRTDRQKQHLDIPETRLADAKRIANVPQDDPNAVWSYQLSASQACHVAAVIGGTLDPDAEFFLEAFADPIDDSGTRADQGPTMTEVRFEALMSAIGQHSTSLSPGDKLQVPSAPRPFVPPPLRLIRGSAPDPLKLKRRCYSSRHPQR